MDTDTDTDTLPPPPPPPLSPSSPKTNKSVPFSESYQFTLTSHSPIQLQKLFLDEWVTSSSVLRARSFAPKKGDVIIVGPPRTATGKLGMLLTCLAKQWDQPWDTLVRPPCVEGKTMDDWTTGNYEKFNLYTSHATGSSYARFAQKKDGPKFIVMLRNPYDLRLATYRFFCDHFDNMYNAELQLKFSECISPTEVVNVATPICDFHTPYLGVEPEAYEKDFCASWIKLAKQYRDNVFLVFYEDILTEPMDLLKSVSHFLQCPMSPSLATAIASELDKATTRLRDHHSTYHRVDDRDGCVGDGKLKLDAVSVRKIHDYWETHVARTVDILDKHYATYESFYESRHVASYPFPIEEKLEENYNKRVQQATNKMCCSVQ